EKINYQWSYPNVWPNLVLVAFDGAKRIKNFEKCLDSARIFTNCVEKDYQKTHKLWEKYDAILGEKSRKNEYVETEMLGWTAGTYSVLYDYLKESKNEEN
ncbi:MAG: trehalase family glycosidase, partial [bacterium]|nr:trehalase family glycosidase [bacterium]